MFAINNNDIAFINCNRIYLIYNLYITVTYDNSSLIHLLLDCKSLQDPAVR